MRAVQVIVSGTVQGVGFRAFVEREARALGLDGWVRNRRDGTVEAVLAGGESPVEQMLAILRLGPPASEVEAVHALPHEGEIAPGFIVKATE